MTDSLIPTKSELEKKLGGGGVRSLRDIVKKADLDGSMLLLDCSGSMSEVISTGEKKIEALRSVVADVRTSVNVPAASFGPMGVQPVVDQIPEPGGGTPMGMAIEFGQAQKMKHLIVISDGVPDSTVAAMGAAQAFMQNGGKRIDAIYIGNDGDHGAQFMADLARVGGGTQSVTDLKDQKLLGKQIIGLLGDGQPEKKAIQL